MSFANPLPFWAFIAVAAAAAVAGWLAYRAAPISSLRHRTLSALRFATLLWIVVCLMRPLSRPATAAAGGAVVPILVDASRSMGLTDVDGAPRIDRARSIVQDDLIPSLAPRFQTDVLRFGDRLSTSDAATLAATDRRTALGAALQAVQERYRDRPIAGIILVSDGGDNGSVDSAAVAASGPPIYALGVGPRTVGHDREVASVTAAESVMSDAVATRSSNGRSPRT